MRNKAGNIDRIFRRLPYGCALGALAVIAAPALAQPSDLAVETVTVTGTGIAGAAPVGVNVITLDRDTIEASGTTSIQALLTTVPALTGFGNAGQGAFGSVDASGTYAPTIHSLGTSASNSTLILIDGHRLPLSGVAHTLADPSTIPTIGLQRVEVLPDGASSIYGSDAAAGVLNFITRKGFEGAETQLQYGGASNYGQFDFGQLVGTDWGKGSVMLAYEYVSRSRLEGADRNFVNDNQTFRGLSNLGNFNCGPATIAASSSSAVYAYPYSGAGVSPLAANALCGQTRNTSLLPSESRSSVLVSMEQKLNDRLTVSAGLNWSSRVDDAAVSRGTVTATVFGPGSGKGSQINPFFVAVPGITNGTEVVRYDFNTLLGAGAHTKSGTQIVSGNAGAHAKLWGDWTADLDALFGNSTSFTRSLGTVCTACAYLALNGTTNSGGSLTASANPAVLGTTTITTRPLSTASALNVWGALGQAAASGANNAASVLSQLTDNNSLSQTGQTLADVNLKAQGSLFDLPAGAIKLAVGGEYRHYGVTEYAIANSAAGPSSTNSTLLKANLGRSLYAAYVEVRIPVIAPEQQIPLMRSFDLDISGRYDHYSDVKGTQNPRLAFNWEIADGLKARGSYGTSFVAPALTSTGGAAGITTESQVGYLTGIGGSVTVPATYPNMGTGNAIDCSHGCTVGTSAAMGVIVAGPGGAGVKPETALTYSAGLDLDPGRFFSALDGLFVTATYWQMKFIGAITSPVITLDAQIAALNKNLVINPSQAQIDAAYASGRAVVSVISGPVTFLQYYTQQNAFNLYASGIDLAVDYRFALDGLGDFHAGLEGSQKLRFDQQGGGLGGAIVSNLNHNANATFSSLALVARTSLGWRLDPFAADIFVNYTNPYWQPTSTAPFTGSYHVPANVTVDANLAYDLPAWNGYAQGTKVYLNAINLFDQAPPPYNAAAGYDTLDASPLGRLLSIGLRKRW